MQAISYIAAALYALAMLALLLQGLNLLWLAVRGALGERVQPGLPPGPAVPPPMLSPWPEVTIQIPLYNEPYVAVRVIDACAALAYPRGRLEIQVLDDSTDETGQAVAERVACWRKRGVEMLHVRRAHRTGFKAGALQNGLRIARGTLVAIFDADFVPRPDFLLHVVPRFIDPGLGLVQARWAHLNAEASVLTRVQALGLDAHFATEQRVRALEGCFISFNGTAGVWRRACIEDAGGWQADTLTEDLDLSYRAQLRGWRFAYLHDLEVPAELPADLDALRTQQHRWTKGGVETARKLLGPLWRSAQPLRVKAEGTLQLTAGATFPFIVLGVLLHTPVVLLREAGYGPGEAYFTAMALGLLGLAGFVLVHVFAQRELYPDWGRRLRRFPAFMAGSIGIALSNSRAVWQALRGTRTPFVRTPKYDTASTGKPCLSGAARPPLGLVCAELALAVYAAVGVVLLAKAGAWAAVPIQAVYAAGFGMVAVAGLGAREEPAQGVMHRVG